MTLINKLPINVLLLVISLLDKKSIIQLGSTEKFFHNHSILWHFSLKNYFEVDKSPMTIEAARKSFKYLTAIDPAFLIEELWENVKAVVIQTFEEKQDIFIENHRFYERYNEFYQKEISSDLRQNDDESPRERGKKRLVSNVKKKFYMEKICQQRNILRIKMSFRLI